MHKRDKISRFIGWSELLKNFYMHFVIEHTLGHHKNVATPEDPASAEKNQTVYSFMLQSFVGGYKSSWGIE
jgi:alkane 1-monooxygenase